MATETLEEKKPEEEGEEEEKTPVEGKEESEREKSAEKPEEGKEDSEMPESKELSEKAEEENEENEAQEEKNEDFKDQEEEKEEEEEEGTTEKARRSGKKGTVKEDLSKEAVTASSSDRPSRERKVVQRYSAPELGRSASKPLSIEKGRGTKLRDIPNVAFKLSKRKPDDNLQLLHTILFGKKAKAYNLKKDIGQFSGYVWVENEEKQKAKVKEKLEKCVKEKLMDFCDVLNIQVNRANVRKEELTVKLFEFLESPHVTTDVLLAEKEQKGKKRKVMTSKNASPGETFVTPVKKQKQASQTGEKQKHSSKNGAKDDEDKVGSPEVKDDSQEEDENDTMPKEESDDEDSKTEEEEGEAKEQMSTPKTSRKTVKESSGFKGKDKSAPGKATPAKPVKGPAKSMKKSSHSLSKQGGTDTDGTKSKGSASKKQKVNKDDPKDHNVSTKDKGTGKKKSAAKSSLKDQGTGKSSKKSKEEPTREEMHAVVVDILKDVDFNTATLSDILRQLGTHFGINLMHRKAEVKDIITEVINNVSDAEDEGDEAEDSAEAGGDAEKDDGEDDA